MQTSTRATQRVQSYNNCENDAPFTTAYCGAQGIINDHDHTPAIRLDKDFEDIRLTDPLTITPSTPREGLGSRFLSTLSAGSPTAAALHSRAKSWTAYVPKLNTNSTPSPEKSPNRQSRIFGDLFSGESAPVKLGVPTSPTKEKELDTEFVMEYQPGFTERPPYRRRESAMSARTTTPKTGKSSWFNRKASQPAPRPTTQDEILNININNTLFPHGPADVLSPQAFNDLLLNATDLLQRMQTAYKEKVDYISSIQPELDAQKEEAEEAQTRSEHLRLQLEDIGRKNEEQRQVNEELLVQLSQEKVKLQEAREAAKTIRLVRRDTEAEEMTDEEGHRRRKRGSAGSASDSGFESDVDTASIFSAGMETPVSQRQPQFTLTPNLGDIGRNGDRPPYSRSSTISQQSTAYSSMQNTRRPAGEGAAWATVEMLMHENSMLKRKVHQMEESLQDCISLVNGATGL